MDSPWEEVVSSSPGRLEGVLRRLVEEASSNPNQATGTNVSSCHIIHIFSGSSMVGAGLAGAGVGGLAGAGAGGLASSFGSR